MKIIFDRLLLVFIGLLSFITLVSCATNCSKMTPEYKGVDPRVQSLVNEYKDLAKIQGITFKNEVTIGFKKLNCGNAVGITYYGWGWREIDIDSSYYYSSTETTKLTLLFHELDHAYCGRKHDYNGVLYPATPEARLEQAKEWSKTGGPKPGRYDDGCSKSFMYPVVLSDDCVLAHYNDYVIEMFKNCSSW
jgi:hypothetical protein